MNLKKLHYAGAHTVSPWEDPDSIRARRKHRRVAAREVTADIRSRGSSASYTVLNISNGGLMISGGRPPLRGMLLEIELRQGGTRSLSLLGKVVHELPEGTGIAFEPFSSETSESLEKLIVAVDARNNLPPPLPPRGSSEPPLPTGPDPFSTGPDPRPPRSGSPDERIDYLRSLVKKRDEGLQRGRAMFAALSAEADELRAAGARLKTKLDATVNQLALGEAALAAARKSAEKQASELEQERAVARKRLEAEQRETLEALAGKAALEERINRLESEAAVARREAETARREVEEVVSETTGLRKARAELAAANKKAMEAQVALTKERAGRLAAEAVVQPAQEAQRAAEDETIKVTSELARLKAKLIAAENALERMAARRAK